MPLDPAAERLLELIRLSGRPPLESLPPDEARQAFLQSIPLLQPDPPEVAAVVPLSIPGPAGVIAARLYRGAGTAPDAELPALLYLHGGGWVIGDLESHDTLCRALANHAGCAVIAVDYRLAPEHVFPAAVEDSVAALRWIAAEAEGLRIDPARIAVGGDSAGGNLAAVLALLARDGQAPSVCLQMLLYPVTDCAQTQASYASAGTEYLLTTAGMRWFRELYLPRAEDVADWRASPLRAPDLRGLPPAYVVTAAADPLCDEGIAYARRLEAEGVRVTHVHHSDQMHGFLSSGRLVPAAVAGLAMAGAALRAAFAPVPG
jgi:acetyl esterase